MKTSWLLIVVECVAILGFNLRSVHAQELEDIQKRTLSAIETVENIPAFSMKVKAEVFNSATTATIHKRGLEIWQEFESHPIADYENSKLRFDELRKVSGCDLSVIHAFDGRHGYTFSPVRVNLRITKDGKYPTGGATDWELPSGWVSMRPEGYSFKTRLTSKNATSLLEKLPDGKFVIKQKG